MKIPVIESILDKVDFGSERIYAGMLLNEACLISTLLFCSEVWTPLSLSDIRELEKIDNFSKRKLLKAQAKTPTISFHLELGTYKLRHIILKRRLMYFHGLINKDENNLLKKILQKQEQTPTKGDFLEQIKNDNDYLGIHYDTSELKVLCKEEFKQKIKKSIENVAFYEYIKEKNTMKKLSKLNYTKFQIQEYIMSKEITTKQKQIIFSIRTYTYKVKGNLPKQYQNNLKCRGCNFKLESQEHVFTECPFMLRRLKNDQYLSIFTESNINKNIATVVATVDEEWRQLLDKFDP